MEGPRAAKSNELFQVIQLINNVFRVSENFPSTMDKEFPLLLCEDNIDNIRIVVDKDIRTKSRSVPCCRSRLGLVRKTVNIARRVLAIRPDWNRNVCWKWKRCWSELGKPSRRGRHGFVWAQLGVIRGIGICPICCGWCRRSRIWGWKPV